MACTPRYVGLPCPLSGVGYSAAAAPLGAASITLQSGQGAFFPEVNPGQFFYVEITDACGGCCEQARVVGKMGDVLLIERDAPGCCFASNSRVRYTSSSRDAVLAIAEEAPINVLPPLLYDCETRTLSVDCAALAAMVAEPCA